MLKLIQKKLLDKIVSRVFMKLLCPSLSPRGDGLPLEETLILLGDALVGAGSPRGPASRPC